MILFYALFVLTIVYVAFLLFILSGTFYVNARNQVGDKKHFLSVIIAARNEENNLVGLLEALIVQNYPKDKFEIIVVDDRSKDQTESILKNYSAKYDNIIYHRIKDTIPELVGKKRALTEGMTHARGEIMLFTDADCRPHPGWLTSMNTAFSQGFDAVVGYSPLLNESTNIWQKIVHHLKKLERMAMFTLSAGSIGWNWGMTATGRNFAYKKKVFEELAGFEGIGFIPSGDDDLFLQKISRSKKYKLCFVTTKDSFVPSLDNKSYSESFNQEKRRGSKFRFYSFPIKLISSMMFIYLTLLFFTFILCLADLVQWKYFLIPFIIKCGIDFLILLQGAVIFREYRILCVFPFAEVLYAPYFIVFGLLGTFRKYTWK